MTTNKWTSFHDMNSGGGKKEPYRMIFIEAEIDEAKIIFYNRFGHNPERVTCTCCGDDYSIGEEESLSQATAFHRGCDYAYFRPDGSECDRDEGFIIGKGMPDGYSAKYVERKGSNAYREYQTLSEYEAIGDMLVIRSNEIKDSERKGTVPEQGYVWQD